LISKRGAAVDFENVKMHGERLDPRGSLEAAAEYLVTGDKDLLHLKTFREIRIVTPRDFELLFDQ